MRAAVEVGKSKIGWRDLRVVVAGIFKLYGAQYAGCEDEAAVERLSGMCEWPIN